MKQSQRALLLLSLVGAGPVPPELASDAVTVVDRNLQVAVVPQVERYLSTLPSVESKDSPSSFVDMADLTEPNRTACLDAMNDALAMYPHQLVTTLIKEVVLADDIRVWGSDVGGVQAPGLTAINCMPANRQVLRDIVHSSIAGKLLHAAPPDWSAWDGMNESGFKYGDLEAFKKELDDPDARNVRAGLNARGFVAKIGLTGRDSDFQSYAEQVFGHGAEFAAIVRANPAMRGKLRLLIRCYLQVAPDLRRYFERTGLLAAAGAG